jgi:hypothetical protein
MPVIRIEKDYLSLQNIQQCVDLFQEIHSRKQAEKRIHLKAVTHIKGFDMLIVAYFVLFINQVKEIELIIDLPFNLFGSGDEPLEYQLKQAGTYAYIITGKSVFTIISGERADRTVVNFDLNKRPVFPDTWFVYSKDFFPFLFINDNQKQFELLFKTGLCDLVKTKLDQLEKGVQWIGTSEMQKNECNSYIRNNSSPLSRKNSLINLAKMAFYNALDEAKIAHLYFEGNYDISQFDNVNRIQAGNLVNKKAFDFFLLAKPLFVELSNKSIIYQFLFSTILSTELLNDRATGKDILNDDTKDDFIDKLFELWNFTKDLVVSLEELSKNIKEHAKPAVGAIALRVFESHKWDELKVYGETAKSAYTNYTRYLSKEVKRKLALIDINIFDLGKDGVITTLIESSKKLIRKDNAEVVNLLIREDIKLLNDNKIKFQNLLDTSRQQLNQQSKRSIAHFGLQLSLPNLMGRHIRSPVVPIIISSFP